MIPLLLFASAAAPFSGTWVLDVDGRPALVLVVDSRGGTLTRPATFSVDAEGDVSEIGGKSTQRLVKWTRKPGEFRAGEDLYRIEIQDSSRATLAHADLPWLTIALRRARPGEAPAVPSPWPAREYPPEIAALRRQLREMVAADQKVRVAGNMSAGAMEAVDGKHRPEIERIFERHGWPKRSLVGKDAAHDFWLLVQHQPLDLQERLIPDMERAVEQGEASRANYAYLYDRVRVGQGKPQRWGTQAKCVNGLPVLSPVEDQAGLDLRRRELRMPPIAVYLSQMKDICRVMR